MADDPSDVPSDPISLLFRLGLGPWCTPLKGKIPVLDAWQSLPAADEATVREWYEAGYNLGVRTGARSGLVAIDDDQPRHGGGPYKAPPTGLIAESPTGGRHYYYRCPSPAPHNSVSLLAPRVDVRGEGGQTVVPPSVHPVERMPYRWVSAGEPAPFPADALPVARAISVDMSRATNSANTNGAGYANTALVREVGSVRIATEGTRNDTLNRAAFNLGQLVAGGALIADTVRAELLAAASIAGLPESEAAKTIRSGMTAGYERPRSAPASARANASSIAPAGASASTSVSAEPAADILVPGSHIIDGGEYVEQGHHKFAEDVLRSIAPGALYRRAATLGEIHDGQFGPTPVHRLRTIIDGSVRLVASKAPAKAGDDPDVVFRPCNRDYASVVLEYGQTRGRVRDLIHLAAHPVCLAPDFAPAHPGWNADHGVYLACESVPDALPLDEARAVLEDLVADFPFQAEADRANFFGLLLTPILRPAIDEPVPMHLIGSSIERTGKTKLAEIVLGVAIAGRRTPAMQLGEREEEREKRILSVLLRGQGLLHLDNLRDFIDSPALASLLTSSEYQGRLLGQSAAPTIPNGLTVVGTGNNVHATGEIAKRIVPIRLLPASEAPETRTDFRHPDLLGYVTAARYRVLGALLGLIAHWRAQGRPLVTGGFGGFERWTAVVGGIMRATGHSEWLTNMGEWRGTADDSGEEHRSLALAWVAKYGHGWTAASLIYDLAAEMDLYGWLDSAKTDRARRRVFAVRVLNRLAGRVIAGCRVESDGVGSQRRVRMDIPSTNPQARSL